MIDLTKRGSEVRKLFMAGFGSQVAKSGYDVEDVLQEVYQGLLVRNKGTCPFDEKKSSFGHYVHMVCECVVRNYHRKENRKRRVEQVGLSSGLKDDVGPVDASLAAERIGNAHALHDEGNLTLTNFLYHLPDSSKVRLTRQERDDIRLVVPHLIHGVTKREIMEETGLSPVRAARAINSIRKHVQLTLL